MASSDIPAHEPVDSITAPAAETREMARWVSEAFSGAAPQATASRARVELRRQEFASLEYGQSCMETRLTIGSRTFKHGLGTHAPSEIVVHLPSGVATFEASVGVDNNFDTQGMRGSVRFSVEINGKVAFRSETLMGGGEAVPVRVDIPPGAPELVLKTDPASDGPAWDQADWADARVVKSSGKTLWLDSDRTALPFQYARPPFSFVYGDGPSDELLPSWPHTVTSRKIADRTEHTVCWADPATGLAVTAVVSAFSGYPAVEWVLSFENRGTSDTPIIRDIQALDVLLRAGSGKKPAMLHTLRGDSCNETSFQPVEKSLFPGNSLRSAASGGRSSQIDGFPFFNYQYADAGLIAALGWTGQWAATLERSSGAAPRLLAGMEKTHLVLHPGEKIRSPRILLMSWNGDRQQAHNRFRRLLMWHYVPKQNGRPLRLPVALQTFDRYNATPGWATEAGQLQAVDFAHRAGFDHYWLDAAWFPNGFPSGVGSWRCDPQRFPNGLKPISDACHERGMKFILWFEPERVAKGSDIANERPEFVFGGTDGGLFKLNDPPARQWLTDLLSRRITEFGLDVYRNDFNMDPLPFWHANDTEDRQGMTEIRYVEGLYQMWDDLLARHPGLWIDNCSSGGRRIDLEMLSRSIPLWRSDTNCWAGTSDWSQSQGCGLSMYVPLHTASAWTPDAYTARSSATAGLLCEYAYQDKDFPLGEAQASLAEVRTNARFWYGDFYPLTSLSPSSDQFLAFQLHRPDLEEGLITAFRRAECDTIGIIVAPKLLKESANYRLEIIGDDRKARAFTVSGRSLLKDGIELRISNRRGSLLVRYQEIPLKGR